MKLSALAALMIAAVSMSASAENQWGVGVGTMVQNQGYADIGAEFTVIPSLYFESEDFSLYGPTLAYRLFDGKNLELSLVGQYRFDGFDEDVGDIFLGMDKRSGSFDAGINLDYRTDLGDFSFKFLNDVTQENEGRSLSVSYAKPFNFKDYGFSPFVSVTHLSDKFVDYYYGVRAHEVRSDRAFYQGDATTNVEVGVRSHWQLGEHHSFIANASYTAFGAEIKDSPLVEESGGFTVIAVYTYVF